MSTIPLSNKEYYALRNLFGMVNNFNQYAADLKHRCESIDVWADYQLLIAMSERLMADLLLTIPPKKLLTMKKDLDHTICECRIAYDYAKRDEREFTYCSTEAIDELVSMIMNWECLSCDKNAKEARKCRVFKAIDACFSWELAPNGDVCPLAGIIEDY